MIRDDGGAGDPGAAEDRGETRALDTLLRGERAAIAVTVALASGATTYAERARLAQIGGELVVLCCALRERLDLAGRFVPPGVAPEAVALLATDSYDARLAALGEFLDATAGQATAALGATDDSEFTRTLRDLIPAHAQAAQWLRERAAVFAATRAPGDPPPQDSSVDAPDALERDDQRPGDDSMPDDMTP